MPRNPCGYPAREKNLLRMQLLAELLGPGGRSSDPMPLLQVLIFLVSASNS
jgi:hypothetical protein